MRLAKIIATLGPASESREVIKKLLEAGVDVIRLNFSHGAHEEKARIVRDVREISQEINKPVAILGDLQGPKFRIGELENHQPVLLEEGATVCFKATQDPGNQKTITTIWAEMIEELQVGDDVLINDGAIRLKVLNRINPKELECQVVVGGLLSEKKGINVPSVKLASVSAMTEKDQADAIFALQHGLDYIALSFVRSYQDINFLRQFLEKHLPEGHMLPHIVAKIEKPQALDEIDAIIEASDAIMVARGDLGVELQAAKVPIVQKTLIQKANEAEKPVITATQILESMIQNPVPTRAEVSDIANAVFDGTDALMLSAETAAGKYPVEAVRTMARIIEEAESHFEEWRVHTDIDAFFAREGGIRSFKFHEVIAQAACFSAKKSNAKAVVVLSFSGKMAVRLSKNKPQLPIFAFTPHKHIYRRLSLVNGVHPLKIAAFDTSEAMMKSAEKTIQAHGLLQPKDPIVFCVGQTHVAGMSNTLKLYPFGDLLDEERQAQQTAAAAATA